ncbi:hypothetical protein DFJ74DRAFT_84016 [Hyaloraphidium curvatum]|nr:hypothetical protein DFJ74DRAFT_84016 [Hyaloraphidium curvatum]
MRTLWSLVVVLAALATEPYVREWRSSASTKLESVHGFSVTTADGKDVRLATLIGGNITLIVNTASYCGLTPQYAGLEALYRKYRDRGFTVLGAPCNGFGAQEPEDMPSILAFTSKEFGVSFPMLSKVEVNGPNEHPLFKFLKDQKASLGGQRDIQWNFAKFLLDRRGFVRERFLPTTSPEAIEPYIVELLEETGSRTSSKFPRALDNFVAIGRWLRVL